MIETIADLPGHVLGFTARGKVTGEDYATVVVPAVEAAFARHAKLRLIYRLGGEFEGFEPAALWDDTKVGLKHLRGWERVALVTDVEWLRGAMRLFGLMMPGELRVFDDRDFPEALRWVCA